MLFILLIILTGYSFSMERQGSIVNVDSPRRSPFGSGNEESSQSEASDEEDLCEFAMSKYLAGITGVDRYLKTSLRSMLQDKPPLSPGLAHASSNAELLRRARLSSMPVDSQDSAALSGNDQRIYDMILRAMHKSVEEKESILQEKERLLTLKEQRIKEKYSGKKTAAIATITGTITTTIAAICTAFITIGSK